MTELLGIPNEEAEGREIIRALVDALRALEELTDASESVHIYPEGSVGLDDLQEAETKARAILDRFDLHPSDD